MYTKLPNRFSNLDTLPSTTKINLKIDETCSLLGDIAEETLNNYKNEKLSQMHFLMQNNVTHKL